VEVAGGHPEGVKHHRSAIRLDEGKIAHLFTVLTLKRSILTEKISRRGYHLSREYAIDPLEILFVREVMQPDAQSAAYPDHVVAHPDEPLRVVVYRMAETGFTRLPVIDPDDPGKQLGVVTLEDLLRARTHNLTEERERERVLRINLPGAERARPGRSRIS